ncbi:competence protein ComEC [Flavobacterium piscis]|uniref:Competence protein ComEC n=1 Tax=Flavobacterium piscis TaxID=1114874 RepID=A0ABX2XJX1_9FLAO|nr:ComEC/Rec2 family competence protein [Flavobacterium piscis]OCB75621.1 competence protein ComEC [Flavobacterium piscis]OXE99681.1 competence protein ComEC [Flavobacterium piscis]
MKVLDFPLTKITIWFLFGILFCYYCKPSLDIAFSVFIVAIIVFTILYFLIKRNKRFTTFFGINTYFISFAIGILTLLLHTNSLQKSNYIHCKKAFETPQIITFTLREKLKSNAYNDRFIAIINNIDGGNYSGKIIVNIQKDSLKNLIIGNVIKVKTVLQQNSSNKNPNQFDYGKYLADKQIYAQIYTNKTEITINKNPKKDIWYYSGRLHSRIVRNLEKANFNNEEMNVALALILGQQQDISSEIIQDYQYSGATHILSVSGLHVGFIMLFINFILKPIPNTRKGSLIKLISILLSLGAFAIISGLSPSVLRSVVMFSFLAIGNHLRRSGSIYHTLLVSMLLILLCEPYFLFDVGFQLSYLALFFIVWLQPLLKQIWTPKHKIQTTIWNALTVSFAAQIGTLPLCLYYFHQFPGLFFVTNIVIIPILSFIMIAGIIVMILAIFMSPPAIIIEIFEKSIYLLNKTIHIVASFEWFVIRDISFNFYYLLTFYIFIISAIVWNKKPNYNQFAFLLITIVLLQLSFIYTKKEIENTNELIVYNTKKNTLLSERTGKKITLFTNDTLSKNSILNAYLVGNFGKLSSTNKIKNVLYFNGKKISIIDSSGIYETRIQPDILILTQSPKINLDRILEDLHPKIIIADASNSYSIQKTWKYTCLKRNIPFHATSEKGYYKLN